VYSAGVCIRPFSDWLWELSSCWPWSCSIGASQDTLFLTLCITLAVI
jgi:hypothetical protein